MATREQSNRALCPFCKSRLREGAERCPTCRRPLPVFEWEQPKAPIESHCPACGGRLHRNQSFFEGTRFVCAGCFTRWTEQDLIELGLLRSGERLDELAESSRAAVERIEQRLASLEAAVARFEMGQAGAPEPSDAAVAPPALLAPSSTMPTAPGVEAPVSEPPGVEAEQPAQLDIASTRIEATGGAGHTAQLAAEVVEPGKAPARATAPLPPPIIRPTPAKRSGANLEDLLSERGLAWAGGLAIIAGAVFFLSLAFSRGWIGPSARVVIGVVAATLFLGAGARLFERAERRFGLVLMAVGFGVMGLSLIAATRLYDLIPISLGLAGSLVTALAAAGVAIRNRTQVVAALGLVAVLAAPPALGASADATTVAFLTTVLIGTTLVALRYAWSWLPLLAFGLTAPQIAAWIADEPSLAGGLAALGGFWLLHTIAAGGAEIDRPSERLGLSSALLTAANSLFLVLGGAVLLDDASEREFGLFLLAVALAHVAVAGLFLQRHGNRHGYGQLVAGIGTLLMTLAAPALFDGPPVAIAWAGLGVALFAIFGRTSNRWSAIGGAALLALSIIHLGTVEYRFDLIDGSYERRPPFLNQEGGTLAAILVALAVASWLARLVVARLLAVSVGGLLVLLVLPFEISGLALLAAWAAIGALGAAAPRWRSLSSDDLMKVRVSAEWQWLVHGARLALVAVPVAAALAVAGHLLRFDLPYAELAGWTRPATPFTDRATAAAVIALAGVIASAVATTSAWLRRWWLAGAHAIGAYLMLFELGPAARVVVWSAMALIPLGLLARDRGGREIYLAVTGALFAAGAAATLATIAPPDRLAVDARTDFSHPFLWSGATLALLAIAIATAIVARRLRAESWAWWLGVAAGVAVLYLLSVGVVDHFQGQVGEGAALDTLEKRAQVALTILWAVLGGAVFAAGVVRGIRAARRFGLALLWLATAKVIAVDLRSLDASYRVLSFIGLGLLLLASSYLYQRLLRGQRAAAGAQGTGEANMTGEADTPVGPT